MNTEIIDLDKTDRATQFCTLNIHILPALSGPDGYGPKMEEWSRAGSFPSARAVHVDKTASDADIKYSQVGLRCVCVCVCVGGGVCTLNTEFLFLHLSARRTCPGTCRPAPTPRPASTGSTAGQSPAT